MQPHQDSVPIPPLFQSTYHEGPFCNCSQCEVDFTANSAPYIIAKHIVVREPVFEVALCLPCGAAMQSQETQQRISAFVQEKLQGKQREEPESWTWEDSIRCCLICDKPREQCHRYQLGALCMQLNMLVTATPHPTPYMICDDCAEQLQELLSQQTRDNWNRFMERFCDGPPGIELDSPRFDPVLV